jgi:hypothetical protein
MGSVKKGSIQTSEQIYHKGGLSARSRGRINKERYQRDFDISAEQVTGMSKWLTASLFAANSGGVLTVLNTADKLSNPATAATLFAGGLVFALLSGTAIQEFYNQVSDPLDDLIQYWSEIEEGQPENIDRFNEIVGRLSTIKKWTWTAPIPGWLSGVLFVAASFAVAYGLGENGEKSNPPPTALPSPSARLR